MTKPVLGTLLPINGIRLGTTCAGIKTPDRRDLVVIEIDQAAHTAAVFTQNAFCAAPVTVAKHHLEQSQSRYLVINTGNANAGTGEQGLKDAQTCCEALANITQSESNQVLPFSTGVIGESLPVEKISQALPEAVKQLNTDGWEEAAHGILTTDTVPKGYSKQIDIDGQTITITGIAKGAGMIRPDMATMLAYVATDAKINQPLLNKLWKHAVDASFNRISVDGDTSTNDAVLLIATGLAEMPFVNSVESTAYQLLQSAITELCEDLAKDMIRDGEGATKLITIEVSGGADEAECKQVAYTIAHSPLVKTAMFASDPNWGRILAAVGRAGVPSLDVNKIGIHLDDVCIVRHGGRAPEYSEQQGQQVMDKSEITIRVELGRGKASTHIWTCDFSYDYVRINAEYRT